MALNPALSLLLVSLALYLFRRFSKTVKLAPLPPGPKPKFLIGNLFDLPKSGELEWEHWLKHKDLYGPISSVTVNGQTLVIINDARLAFDLMEKRSALHSSRPTQVFSGEMVGWENALGFLPYSKRFRATRKLFSKTLGSNLAVSRFNPLQEIECGRFLLRVLENPDELVEHIRKEAGAVILKISYGYTIEPHKRDPLVTLVGDVMDHFAQAVIVGVWMVDMIPFLRYLPDWFPGTGFKRIAREWNVELSGHIEWPLAFVKKQMEEGKHEMSFLSQNLESKELDPEEEFILKWTSMVLYSAGADTTVSSMECFFLAMTVYPSVQRKAQEELDRVIGPDRLPGFQDRENLPYINAVVKEVLRWHPVAPLALPHMTTEDDIYEGYLIPKGALLLPNVWHFTHDPQLYHEPMLFKPERFLSTEDHVPELDSHKLSFGFGRRVCPGRLFAKSALYINIAQTLAVFNIDKPIENGQTLDPEVKFLSGVISHPAPFKTAIKPRSPSHETLIRSIEKIHPWQESDAKVLESIPH